MEIQIKKNKLISNKRLVFSNKITDAMKLISEENYKYYALAFSIIRIVGMLRFMYDDTIIDLLVSPDLFKCYTNRKCSIYYYTGIRSQNNDFIPQDKDTFKVMLLGGEIVFSLMMLFCMAVTTGKPRPLLREQLTGESDADYLRNHGMLYYSLIHKQK